VFFTSFSLIPLTYLIASASVSLLQVFDIPSMGDKPFEERYDHLKKLFGEKGTHASDKVKVVEHEKAKSRQHVLDKLKEVESLGGEGLMLRKAGS
jgi:DNA ligase 1